MLLRPQVPSSQINTTLVKQLGHRDLRLAETTLGMCSPHETLKTLAWILEHDRRRARRVRGLHLVLGILIWGAYSLWALTSWHSSDWFTVLMVGIFGRAVQVILKGLTGSSNLRSQNARLVAGTIIQQADRESLGEVLVIAEAAFLNHARGPERAVCREYLTRTLGRFPANELSRLTPSQRRALRAVTYASLTSKDNAMSTLGAAGLLTLATLRDPALVEVAQKAAGGHRIESVRVAALEYLSAVT